LGEVFFFYTLLTKRAFWGCSPIRQPAEHVAYNIDPDSLSEFYAWPSDHSNTNFGYRTSYAGSLATNPIPNSNAGGFGLLEPNFYRGHNYPMQSWDLGNECGVDRVSYNMF
jgi:hypothetical protein